MISVASAQEARSTLRKREQSGGLILKIAAYHCILFLKWPCCILYCVKNFNLNMGLQITGKASTFLAFMPNCRQSTISASQLNLEGTQPEGAAMTLSQADSAAAQLLLLYPLQSSSCLEE